MQFSPCNHDVTCDCPLVIPSSHRFRLTAFQFKPTQQIGVNLSLAVQTSMGTPTGAFIGAETLIRVCRTLIGGALHVFQCINT
jgi:hypothetical protein